MCFRTVVIFHRPTQKNDSPSRDCYDTWSLTPSQEMFAGGCLHYHRWQLVSCLSAQLLKVSRQAEITHQHKLTCVSRHPWYRSVHGYRVVFLSFLNIELCGQKTHPPARWHVKEFLQQSIRGPCAPCRIRKYMNSVACPQNAEYLPPLCDM